MPSPLLYGDQLYFTQSNQGILTSLNTKDGSEAIERTRVPNLGDIYASPVGAQGRIYLTGRKGTTVVIEDGMEFKLLATNRLTENFHASPALAGNQLFLRGMRHLYCLQEGAKAGGLVDSTMGLAGLKREAETRKLLELIAKRELPKDYPGKGHQIFVDSWFKTAGRKGARVGELWKEQQRLFPEMENRGFSFIRILDYVRRDGAAGPVQPSQAAAKPKGNPNIKRKAKAEIRSET